MKNRSRPSVKTGAAVTGLVLIALSCQPFPAQAQTPSRSAPPSTPTPTAPAPAARDVSVAPRPDRTTASYGDWVLRCELAASGERSCEVAQTVQDGRGQPLAQITFRRSTADGKVAMTAQVGTNITVAEPLRVLVEDQPALVLAFRRCIPRGCFAEVQVLEGEPAALARRAEAAKLDYRDADGGILSIPLSLRGLTPALEALRAERRG